MRWWQLAARQAGVITHAQLLQCGLSATSVNRLAASGALCRVARGVYLAGPAPQSQRARLWAAQLSTGGVLTGMTAGALWQVYDGPAGQSVYVTVAVATHIATPPAGVVVHRSALPREVVTMFEGLAVTSRRWTVLDLLGFLPLAEAMRLADRALQRRWITTRDCQRRISGYPGRRGNAQLRVVASRLGDGAAADSERLLHTLLRKAGLRGWIANYEVWAGGELIGVIDVAIPARRVAIEVDGMAYHVDVDRFRRDRSKQNALTALGWTVLRFTWADLTERPGYVVALLQRLAA